MVDARHYAQDTAFPKVDRHSLPTPEMIWANSRKLSIE